MSDLNSLGIAGLPLRRSSEAANEYLLRQRPLQRVLAFRGRTIDDVVNDPIVKNEIFGYWKLHKQVLRASEVVDLERQWNPRGGKG